MHHCNDQHVFTEPLSPQNEQPSSPRLVYVLDVDRAARIETVVTLRNHGFEPHPYVAPQDLLDDLGALGPGCILVGTLDPDFGILALLGALGNQLAETPVVVSVLPGDVTGAVQAMMSGASNVIERDAGCAVLPVVLDPIFAVSACHELEARTRISAKDAVSVLSPREYNILSGLVEGLSSRQIATALGLNVRTVEMSRSKMMRRLGARTLSDVLGMAFRANVPPLNHHRESG